MTTDNSVLTCITMSYNLLTVKYVQIPAIRKSLYIYIYINVIKKKKSYFI